MTDYRFYPATNGPSSSAGDPTSYIMCVIWQVTAPGQSLLGYWWWVADTNQQPGPFEFALWEVTGGLSVGTATFVPGSTVTSGTMNLGWNLVMLGTPLSLTASQEYAAIIAVNASGPFTSSYSATSHFWDTGAGAGGITNGPLNAFSAASPGTDPDIHNNNQMTFASGITDPTTPVDMSQFNSGNYWLDVQVGAPVPPPAAVLYSMQSFP